MISQENLTKSVRLGEKNGEWFEKPQKIWDHIWTAPNQKTQTKKQIIF